MSTIHNDSTILSPQLKVWENLLIMVGDGPTAGTYVGRIEDFIEGDVLVTAPEFFAGKTLLRDDLGVTVQFTREDAVYQFESHIRRREPSGGNVLLSSPRNFRRVQRRHFVRIEWREEIEYGSVTDSIDWQFFPESLGWRRTVTHDFSSNGVRLSAPTPVPVGSIVLLRWVKRRNDAFPDYTFAICRRIWEEAGTVHSGLEFILEDQLSVVLGTETAGKIPPSARKFDRAVQNKLVVWIFHRQIELRQKGLL